MESEPTAPTTAPDGTAESPVRQPPTTTALVPAPAPEPAPRLLDYVLAAPLGATKTLLDLTDAAADRLAALLGLRREAP